MTGRHGSDAVRVVRVRTPAQLAHCHAVRAEVFIGEQGVSLEEELDGRDEESGTSHVLALAADGTPVGTARLFGGEPAGGAGQTPVVHVGRVAVRAAVRGRSVGRLLMQAAERLALAEHGRVVGGERVVRIELSAQETALGFYERLGYEIDEDRYLDAEMWHRDAAKMVRRAI